LNQQNETDIELERLGKAVAAAGRTGDELFRELARLLWDATGCRFAIICGVIPDDDERLRALALVDDGADIAPFDFDIGASPWRDVLEHGHLSVYEHVAQHYPDAVGLTQFGLEAYVGERVVDASGRTRGLVSINYDRPLASTRLLEQYLKIFAHRVGAEFDRMDAAARLADENRNLTLLATVSAELARVSIDEADDVLPALLGRVGAAFGVDRIVAYRFDAPSDLVERLALWRADGLPENAKVDPLWRSQAHRFLDESMEQGAPYLFVTRSDAPDGIRELLTAYGMNAYVNIPIAGPKGGLTGGMVLYSRQPELPWLEARAATLKLFSSAFAATAFRLHADREKAHSAEQLRRAAVELAVGEERLRANIASELHDNVLQDLASLKIMLDQIAANERRSHGGDSALVAAATAQKIINDTRALLGNISPPVLKTLGLPKALEWLVERTGRDTRVRYECRFDPALSSLEAVPDLSLVLFQVVRELLVNVRKHADAGRLEVEVSIADGQVMVDVVDDGEGMDPATLDTAPTDASRFGLLNVRNRIEYLGGRFSIVSTPGHGTRIHLEIPFTARG